MVNLTGCVRISNGAASLEQSPLTNDTDKLKFYFIFLNKIDPHLCITGVQFKDKGIHISVVITDVIQKSYTLAKGLTNILI